MHVEILHDVPNAMVDQIVEDFKSQGATVVVTPNSNGTTSTITATWSNATFAALSSATAAHASAAAAHASAAEIYATALKAALKV